MNTWSTPTVNRSTLPKILLVDDEQLVLDALRRVLRREFEVTVALSGAEGLDIIGDADYAAVVSDMRMPHMDGAAFLSRVREVAPDTVRILLTGQADTESAIAAINQGQIFRFLTKPCGTDAIAGTLRDAVEIYRLRRTEKELLEQTLRGAVRALVETLSLAKPVAFARSHRIARTVSELAEVMGIASWEIDVAALLAHIGAVSLPTRVLTKLDTGFPLSDAEAEMADRMPRLGRQVVAAIPRLERVADAIAAQNLRFDGRGRHSGEPHGEEIPLAARLLRVATQLDSLTARGLTLPAAIAQLTRDQGALDPQVLRALEKCYFVTEADTPRQVALDELRAGMVLMEDVVTERGTVLIGRGSVITARMLERLRNYAESGDELGAIIVSSSVVS